MQIANGTKRYSRKMEAARSSESAPEQVIAARRLDSELVKQRAKDAVECCSLGAAEFQRSAATF